MSVVGPATIVLLVVMVGSATAVHLLEPEAAPTLTSSAWWALSRLTALGDGGVALVTPSGRAVEVFMVLTGLAFLSLITAAIATVFVRADQPPEPQAPRLEEVVSRLERIESQLARGEHDGNLPLLR